MKKRIYFSLFLVFMLLLSPSVHAQNETKIGIPIQITTNGSQTTGQVTLSSEDSSAPMPNENPVTIQGKDNVVLSYTKTGTWKYTIKQTAGSDQDTTYDTTLYHLTVFIGYKDGGLYSIVTLFKDGSADKDAEVVFANTKKENQETPVTPPSNKEETPKKETPVNNKKTTTEKKKTNKKTNNNGKNKNQKSSTSENGADGSKDHKNGNDNDRSTEGSSDDVNGSKTGSNGDKTTSASKNGHNNTGTKGVKTSDPTVIIPYVIAVVCSFAVLVFLFVRSLHQKH
ncbi:hypothetical protein SG0102_28810 [Intestinibaculum porci]|uniref:Streptococcal pilin isopeptide linker domain-containing protein n=1 Tax=Intestinibaculum porci TaxID=2487118 RepID=A0A3G9J9R8_9FIRM|nr:hypothetical protein [Intestinibaculum porci]BBH27947.1 hypothetical protein SG0102_28810 [Intestinibaculum porci]